MKILSHPELAKGGRRIAEFLGQWQQNRHEVTNARGSSPLRGSGRLLVIVLSTMIVVSWCCMVSVASACQGVGDIPIQHGGRIKPFSAFAQETVQFVSGKKRWQGKDATDFLMATLAKPEQFREIAFIRIDLPTLKKTLDLSVEDNHFSYYQLKPSFQNIVSLAQAADQKRDKDERPSAIEQQAETLYERMRTVEALSAGETITVVPAGKGLAWTSPFVGSGDRAVAFQKLARDYAARSPAVADEIAQWLTEVNSQLENGLPIRIKMEAAYYKLQPFHYAGILYFLGFLLLLWAKPIARKIAGLVLAAGFVFHASGVILRWLILLRPPVANMYETMIFMDLVLMLTVGIFVVLKKRQTLLSSGAIVSAIVMLYANLLPVDKSLDVLAPVLRSSFWLTTHVIIIISSYSFFAFAMAVSHRQLFLSVMGNLSAKEEKLSAQAIDRVLQIGLIALGVGTILGGVWANESWGRFWGWDPKETWAFITFLGYMAILHLRYRKKLNDFMLAICGILGFLLVMMTWYGVNFVLGRGMHSYGSGSGGLVWIIYYLIFEGCFFAFILIKRKKK